MRTAPLVLVVGAAVAAGWAVASRRRADDVWTSAPPVPIESAPVVPAPSVLPAPPAPAPAPVAAESAPGTSSPGVEPSALLPDPSGVDIAVEVLQERGGTDTPGH